MRISKGASTVASGAPRNLEELAFASVRELAEFVRAKKVSSLGADGDVLGTDEKVRPDAEVAVTLMEERALAQARQADAEIARGKISRAAPRLAVGREGLVGRERIPDDVGRRRI